MFCTQVIKFNLFNSKCFSNRTSSLHGSHERWTFNYNFVEFHVILLEKFFQILSCEYSLHISFSWKWWINFKNPSIIFFIWSSICSLCMPNNSEETMVFNTFMFLNIWFLFFLKKWFQFLSRWHWLTST